MYTVYKITNLTNNKCYIGSSIRVEKRWQEHKNTAFNPNSPHYQYPLYRAFRKYGLKNFSFKIIKNDCTIIDATHISKASRAKILRRVENPNNVRLLVLYLTTPLDICMRQNDLRTGREQVPHEVIEKMAKQFENPTEKEFTGFGFDSVEVWEKPWKEGET